MMLFRKMKFMKYLPMIGGCKDFLFKFKKKILSKHKFFKNHRARFLKISRVYKVIDKLSLNLFLLRKNFQLFKSNQLNSSQKSQI